MDKKKITAYLTLLIGLIVIMIVFFLERKGFDFSTRLSDTYFHKEMRSTFGLKGGHDRFNLVDPLNIIFIFMVEIKRLYFECIIKISQRYLNVLVA